MLKKIYYPSLYEDVADKYAENEFHIPDDAKYHFEQKFLKENNPNLIGQITHSWDDNKFERITNIYFNPKSLDNFDAFVRGIILKNGDLYLADSSRDVIHIDIVRFLIRNGILEGSIDVEKLMDLLDEECAYPKTFLSIHRVAKKNIFGIGESNGVIPDNIPFLKAAEKKNPNFKFANKDVFDLKNILKEELDPKESDYREKVKK